MWLTACIKTVSFSIFSHVLTWCSKWSDSEAWSAVYGVLMVHTCTPYILLNTSQFQSWLKYLNKCGYFCTSIFEVKFFEWFTRWWVFINFFHFIIIYFLSGLWNFWDVFFYSSKLQYLMWNIFCISTSHGAQFCW